MLHFLPSFSVYRIRNWYHNYLQGGRFFFLLRIPSTWIFIVLQSLFFLMLQVTQSRPVGAPQAGVCVLSTFAHQTLSISLLSGATKVFQDHLVTFPAPVLGSAPSLRSPGGPFSGTRCLETTVWALERPPVYNQQHLPLYPDTSHPSLFISSMFQL